MISQIPGIAILKFGLQTKRFGHTLIDVDIKTCSLDQNIVFGHQSMASGHHSMASGHQRKVCEFEIRISDINISL